MGPLFPEWESRQRLERNRQRLKTQLKLPTKKISPKERARIMAMRIKSNRLLILELQGALRLEPGKVDSLMKQANWIIKNHNKKGFTSAQAKAFLGQVVEFSKFI